MKTIANAVTVLTLLSESLKPMGATDLAKAMGLDKSIAHRMLKTLEAGRLVQQDPVSKKYTLGIGFLTMGSRFLHQLKLPKLAHGSLVQLAEETNETIHLCVRSGLESVVVSAYESRQSVRVAARVGDRAPLRITASGKIFLAYGDSDLLAQVMADMRLSTDRGADANLVNLASLADEVATVRTQGFATDIEESDTNYCAYAVPLLAAEKTCVAAIAVALPVGRMRTTPAEHLIAPLLAAARKIGRELMHDP